MQQGIGERPELPPIMWTPLNNLKVSQCQNIITPEKLGFTQMSLKLKL